MTFTDKMKHLVEHGVAASKDIAARAGTKAQDLGEKGVLKFEILQLENQVKKLISQLGSEVYSTFTEKEQSSISRDNPVISNLLRQIADLRGNIAKREKELEDSSKNNV
jgi:hypothetical protein